MRPSHPMASARARYSNMNGGRIFDILGIIMRHHPDGEEEEKAVSLYLRLYAYGADRRGMTPLVE